jgi:hypothetical protein
MAYLLNAPALAPAPASSSAPLSQSYKTQRKQTKTKQKLPQEETQLARFIEEASAWQASAEAMVANLEEASVLEAQALIKATEAVPAHFELKAFLQERVKGACVRACVRAWADAFI